MMAIGARLPSFMVKMVDLGVLRVALFVEGDLAGGPW